jgi:hypothetical protein
MMRSTHFLSLVYSRGYCPGKRARISDIWLGRQGFRTKVLAVLRLTACGDVIEVSEGEFKRAAISELFMRDEKYAMFIGP